MLGKVRSRAPHSYSGARLALTKLTESCSGPRRNDESPMAMMSGGEALARSLAGEGVEVVFGIPGIQIYGIVAALRDDPHIRLISTRHEQATTYMADGYARASGLPGVALVVPGVGLYNSASGLTNAYSRSSPVLLIAGQIPRGAIGKGRGAVHEIENQSGAVSSVTKWQRQVARPREVPEAVFEAFRQMRTGRVPVRSSSRFLRKQGWSGRRCSCEARLGYPVWCPAPMTSGRLPGSSPGPAFR